MFYFRELFQEVGNIAVGFYLSKIQVAVAEKSALSESTEETDNCSGYVWSVVCLSLVLVLSVLINGYSYMLLRRFRRDFDIDMVKQIQNARIGLAAVSFDNPAGSSSPKPAPGVSISLG